MLVLVVLAWVFFVAAGLGIVTMLADGTFFYLMPVVSMIAAGALLLAANRIIVALEAIRVAVAPDSLASQKADNARAEEPLIDDSAVPEDIRNAYLRQQLLKPSR